MDKWIKSPWFIRGVSLFFAILLYTSVSLDNNTTSSDFMDLIPSGSDVVETIDNVPVDIQIDEEKYVVSGVPQSVSVSVEGPNSLVTPLTRQQSLDLFVDLQDKEPGTHQVNIQHSGISEQLSAYIEPKTVEVTIEERQTIEYNVSMDYIHESQLAEGYEIGQGEVNPSKISITGSKSEVEKAAVVKAFVDVNGQDKPIENREAPVKVYDSQGNELNLRMEPSKVEVSVAINKLSKTVPIHVATTGELADGLGIDSINAEPGEIKVYGPKSVLDELEEISTEEIDLSEVTENTTTEATLDVPSEVNNVEMETVNVTLRLENGEENASENEDSEASADTDTTTASVEEAAQVNDNVTEDNEQQEETTVNDLQIEVQNLADTFSLTFLEPEDNAMNLTAIGASDAINSLSKEDFQLSIDVDGRDKGEHAVPINIAGPDSIDLVGQYDNATVRIE